MMHHILLYLVGGNPAGGSVRQPLLIAGSAVLSGYQSSLQSRSSQAVKELRSISIQYSTQRSFTPPRQYSVAM